MARLRSIKPEFFTSEQIAECSPNARLLFIGMWCFCDDAGIHPASTGRLKMEVFPGDAITREEIAEWVAELILAELLTCYEVDGVEYWQVTGWKHQKIDQPTYKYPGPDGRIEQQPNRRRTAGEHSPSVRRTLYERSPPERRGEEKKEIPLSNAGASDPAPLPVTVVFEHWQKVMGHSTAKLDDKRRSAIARALKAGYTVDQLKSAIDGCRANPWHMGQNDRKTVYDALTLILRDAEHIDRFIRDASGASPGDASTPWEGAI